jgi:hypothetical protein
LVRQFGAPFRTLTLTISAAVKTAWSIGTALDDLVGGFKDAPKGIESLRTEYNEVYAALQQLEKIVNAADGGVKPNSEILDQARNVISDTQVTLDELHTTIKSLIPAKLNSGKYSTIQVRCKYLWKEKPIQATVLRLRARKESLGLLMGLWSKYGSSFWL